MTSRRAAICAPKHSTVVRVHAAPDGDQNERLIELLAIGLERWLAKGGELIRDRVDSAADLSVHTGENTVKDVRP